MTGATALDDALPAAREQFTAFLAGLPRHARLVVFCDNDADGLAAGALLARALPRAGVPHVEVTPVRRGESAFTEAARERLRAMAPDALIVADLGVRADGVLVDVPTLYIDHHRPSGSPPDAVVISGYGWDPIPASAWLAFELLHAVAPVDDLVWIAAIGVVSDLGETAPWARLPGALKRYTRRWIKEAVVLVNASRRASVADLVTPLRLLLECEHPRAISEDVDRGADRLHGNRREVNAELKLARRNAPRFSRSGPFALVRLHSRCQIHPLIAQQWRGRLPRYAVIAANTGYMPGVIAFSMRTARADLPLPQVLQGIGLGDMGPRYGHGHDQASGGHLSPPKFDELLARLGFDESAQRSASSSLRT